MSEPIIVYKNLIWEILDTGSKLTLLDILMNNRFKGECKVISKVEGNTTVMEVTDNYGNCLVLPINILDILNN